MTTTPITSLTGRQPGQGDDLALALARLDAVRGLIEAHPGLRVPSVISAYRSGTVSLLWCLEVDADYEPDLDQAAATRDIILTLGGDWTRETPARGVAAYEATIGAMTLRVTLDTDSEPVRGGTGVSL